MDEFQKTDAYGQQKVIEQLSKIFKGNTLTFNQHYIDKSTVDIDMYVTTPLGNTYTYNLEAKDRTYPHTAFGGEWMIEVNKYDELLNKDGKAFYVNTFGDDYITFWDLSKIEKSTLKCEYKLLPKCTLHPEYGKVKKLVYYLPNNLACYSSKYL